MVSKLNPKILRQVTKHEALKHKDGKVFLYSNPCLIVPTYIILYLQRWLEKKNYKDAVKLFYSDGKLQAMIGVRIINERFGYSKKIRYKKELLEYNIGQTHVMGHGNYKWTRMDFKNNIFIAQGRSAIAEEYIRSFGLQKNCVDYLFAGMFAGCLEAINKEKMVCIETRCIAKGNKLCEFVIKPAKKWDKKDPLVKERKFLFRDEKTMKDLGAKTPTYF